MKSCNSLPFNLSSNFDEKTLKSVEFIQQF